MKDSRGYCADFREGEGCGRAAAGGPAAVCLLVLMLQLVSASVSVCYLYKQSCCGAATGPSQAARSHPRPLTVHFGLSECRPFWRLYNVQRFWTSSAERFEKSGGRQVKAERRAQWGQDKGRRLCAGCSPPAWQCGGEPSLSGGQLRFDA